MLNETMNTEDQSELIYTTLESCALAIDEIFNLVCTAAQDGFEAGDILAILTSRGLAVEEPLTPEEIAERRDIDPNDEVDTFVSRSQEFDLTLDQILESAEVEESDGATVQ